MGIFYSATVQFKAVKNAVDENIRRMTEIAVNVKKNYPELKLLVFPEMCTTGYIYHSREEISALAEEATGATFKTLSRFCRENSLYIAYGFPEIEKDVLYNSQNIINDAGELVGCYRKVHLYDADVVWAQPGNKGFMTAQTPLGRLGFGICMDLNYNDFVDYHIAEGTGIICFATNWLEEHIHVHEYWLMRWSGFDNTVLMANTFGLDETTEFCGQSCVISEGLVVCSVDQSGESVIIAQHLDNKG